MNARQLRLVRAAAVSFIATLLAALSHTFGGGAAPHPLLILAVATLLTPLAALLVGVRHSRGRVATAVLLSQGAFHLVFQALGSPTGTGAIGGTGHVHHIDLSLLGPVSAAAVPSTAMLFAHAVAAVLTLLLIWHGESVIRAVVRWFDAILRRAVVAASPPHRRPLRLRSLLLPPFDAAISSGLSRRGPPALVRD